MKKILLSLIFILTMIVIPSYAKKVTLEQKISGLYIASFNKTPDKAGFYSSLSTTEGLQ